MSMILCNHCNKRRAAYRVEMTYPMPGPEPICASCLREVDARQIAAQIAIEPLPEIRPAAHSEKQ